MSRPQQHFNNAPTMEVGVIGNSGVNLTKRKYRTNQILDRKERQPGVQIIDVWAHNLNEEMFRIMELVDDFNYIAMDTEFPGIVARPVGTFKNSNDRHYQTQKCNVDLLKIIQLGLCFVDENGNYIPETFCWQFNFKFSLREDMYAQDSIDLLNKAGIDFKEHEDKGIDVNDFGEAIMTSGIVLNEDVRWISFHSGYDYGYLLKVLTCAALPKDEEEFFELLKLYFPCIYDIKYMMKSCENLKGGLQKVAETLDTPRIGPQHQAGSDSLLTASVFFKMKQDFFENAIDDEKFMGVLFGLGASGSGGGAKTSKTTYIYNGDEEAISEKNENADS